MGEAHLVGVGLDAELASHTRMSALADAINAFEGGCLVITHNAAFAEKTTRETWVVANGVVDIKGDPDWAKISAEAVELGLGQGDQEDALGNKVDMKKKRSPEDIKPKEKKKMTKELKKKIASGDDMNDFEMACATAWNLWV